MDKLPEKEQIIMNHFWEKGTMTVKELQSLYPDPKPHVNTLATHIRILEDKGYLKQKDGAGVNRFYPTRSRREVESRAFGEMIRDMFGNSYRNMVSYMVHDNKLSAEDLQEILDAIKEERTR